MQKIPAVTYILSNNEDFFLYIPGTVSVNSHLLGSLHKLCLFQFFCKRIICFDDRFAKHQTNDQGNT